MQDLTLFRIRDTSLIQIKESYMRCVLFVFALFMIGGNFFRWIPIPGFTSNVSALEGALYFMTFPLYITRYRKSWVLLVALAISTVYGAVLHGFDWTSTLCAVKLVGTITTGVVVGEILFAKYQGQSDRMKRYFVWLFTSIMVLGWVIFFVFPESSLFFELLGSHGIQFKGDPHKRRFISPFFDPNYYSAVACLPLLFAWTLRSKHWIYLVLFCGFLASIFLSFSRSGIATLVLLGAGMAVVRLRLVKPAILQKKALLLVPFSIAIIVGLGIVYSKPCLHFLSRTIYFFEDESALARLQTFQEGWKVFLNYPLFGSGFNYLSLFLSEETGMISPDSSLVLLLGNFGLLPVLGFGIIGAVWLFRQAQFFPPLYIYLVVCILFTCQFNNLLFYPYWLIPMLAIFTYVGER